MVKSLLYTCLNFIKSDVFYKESYYSQSPPPYSLQKGNNASGGNFKSENYKIVPKEEQYRKVLQPIYNDFEKEKVFYELYLTLDGVLIDQKDAFEEAVKTANYYLKDLNSKFSVNVILKNYDTMDIDEKLKKDFSRKVAHKWLNSLENDFLKSKPSPLSANNMSSSFNKMYLKRENEHKLHLYILDNYDRLNEVGGFSMENDNSSRAIYKYLGIITIDKDWENGIKSMAGAIMHEILHTLGALDVKTNPKNIMYFQQVHRREKEFMIDTANIQLMLNKYYEHIGEYGKTRTVNDLSQHEINSNRISIQRTPY